MYPRLEINIQKLKNNAEAMLELCKKNNITSCFLVTKVLAGNKPIVEALAPLGFSHIAESRMANLKTYKDVPLPKVYLRIAMDNECKQVIQYADCSLQSEIRTIKLLNEAATKLNKKHQIILMFDLGDLREGLFVENDYLPIIKEILTLDHIQLIGIGTNLTCYGGIIPNTTHLNILRTIKNTIETTFNTTIPLISAGNSSMIHLLDGTMSPKINNLRIGEAIFLGKETSYGQPIPHFSTDAFCLKAKIIELMEKPSYPIGEQGVDSFGQKPNIVDQGKMKRAIIAIGKQDVYPNNIIPLTPNITILGGSSDHTILDVTNTNLKLHDIVTFSINYAGLLQLMTSKYVKKVYKK